MSIQPALPPTPGHDVDPAVEVTDPLAGLYSAGIAKLFVIAVMKHLPSVLEHLFTTSTRLQLPGGADLGSYLAAERIWSEGLRFRTFQLAQECLPLDQVTLAIANTENLMRSELSRVTRAAIDEVLNGNRLGAEAVGVATANACMERVVLGLHNIAADAVR